MEGVAKALAKRVSVGLLHLEAKLKKEWADVLLQEEMLWMQKSRIDWPKLGDKNTRFFHMSTLVRRRKNRVEMLEGDDGEWVTGSSELNKLVVSYYATLFKSEGEPTVGFTTGNFPNVELGVWNEMVKEVTEEETRRALSKMGSYKAPGPDGFPAIFYKKTWQVTGKALHSFVRGILEEEAIPARSMEATIVLIPKDEHPTSIRGFRPLSLCNVPTKLVSKVIVDRLKETLKELISPCQTSFVPGRMGLNNAISCQEVVHSMRHTKARERSCNHKGGPGESV